MRHFRGVPKVGLPRRKYVGELAAGLPYGGGPKPFDLYFPTIDLPMNVASTSDLLAAGRTSDGWHNTTASSPVWVKFGPGVPRITDRGLRVEPARTNPVLYNRDYLNAAWVKTNITVTAGLPGIEGTGTTNGFRLQSTAIGSTIMQAVTAAGGVKTLSIFMRRLSGSTAPDMTMDGGTTWVAMPSISGQLTQYSITATAPANPTIGIRFNTATDQVYVDMCQLEDGTLLTSPIATLGVPVTRDADKITVKNFSSWYRPGAGSLFGDVSALSDNIGAHNCINLDDSGANNWAGLLAAVTTSSNKCSIVTGGVLQATVIANSTASMKLAMAWDTNDAEMLIDGSATVDTSVTVPTGFNRLALGDWNGNYWAGIIRRATYWNYRLSSEDLFEITAPPWVGNRVDFDIDFTAGGSSGKAWRPGVGETTALSNITCVRNSVGWQKASNGTWFSTAANLPRVNDMGLYIEPAGTNYIPNNTATGAVAPVYPAVHMGTWPTGWTIDVPFPYLGVQIIAGAPYSFAGVQYTVCNISSTADAAGTFHLYMCANNVIAATPGQVWTFSFIPMNGGQNYYGLTNVSYRIDEINSTGTVLRTGVNFDVTQLQHPYGSADGRTRITVTFTVGASTAFLRPYIEVSFAANMPLAASIRIGWPQLELSSYASSPMPSTGSGATRAADEVTINTFGSWFVPGPGTIACSAKSDQLSTDHTVVMIDDGTALNNYILKANVAGQFSGGSIMAAGVDQVTRNSASAKNPTTVALTYATNDAAVAIEKNLISTHDTAVTLPTGMTRLTLGRNTAISANWSGIIQRFNYRKIKLNDTRLMIAADLTSPELVDGIKFYGATSVPPFFTGNNPLTVPQWIINYDKPVKPGRTGKIVVQNILPGSADYTYDMTNPSHKGSEPGQVEGVGNQLVFHFPAVSTPLGSGEQIGFDTFDPSAVTDMVGNYAWHSPTMLQFGNATWNVIYVPNPALPPVMTHTGLPDGSVDVVPWTTLTFYCDNSFKFGSGFFRVYRKSDMVVHTQWDFATQGDVIAMGGVISYGSGATPLLNGLLAGDTEYSVLYDAGIVIGWVQAGNTALSDPEAWTFTTLPSMSPEATRAVKALSGGTLPAGRARATIYLMNGLTASGVYYKLDALYVFAAHQSSNNATFNWIMPGPYPMQMLNSPTYTVDRGFTGGGTKYLDSMWSPATAPNPKYALNSASAFAWSLSASAIPGGIIGNADSTMYWLPSDGAGGGGSINMAWGNYITHANTNGTGLYSLTRPDSTSVQLYKNGVVQTTPLGGGSSIAPVLGTGSMRFLTRYNEYWPGQVAAGGFGAALTPAEHMSLYSALNAYLTHCGAVAYEPETDAAVAAFTIPVSNYLKGVIDSVVKILKSNSILPKLDALWLMAGVDEQSSRINICNPTGPNTLQMINGPVFTPGRGFKGNGSTSYLDTGFNPTTAPTPKFTLNDASVFAWSVDPVTNNPQPMMGNANESTILMPTYWDGNAYHRVNLVANYLTPTRMRHGLWSASRSNSTTQAMYCNGALRISSTTAAATGPNNSNFHLLRGSLFWDGQMAAAGIGANLTAAEQSILYEALAGYMRAVGAWTLQPETVRLLNTTDYPQATLNINAADACIVALKKANVWDKLDVLHVYAGNDSGIALDNWKNPGTYDGVLVNGPTFAVNRGFTGGSGKRIDSNFNPTVALTPKYVLNSSSAFGWSLTNVDVSGPLFNGEGGGGGVLALFPRLVNVAYWGLNQNSYETTPTTDSTGLWSVSRTGATTTDLYRNGALLETSPIVSSTLSNVIANVFHRPPSDYWTGQIAVFGLGSGLTAADQLALYNALRTYLLAVGAI